MKARWAIFTLLFLVAPLAAEAEEFKCPEGARDSGERPGMVVRWCEVIKDGRLLYHGPVWRWHRSGQLMAKEYYVDGNMDGEVPAWFENGKQSSLGSFKNGKRIGPWRFWDEEGRIKSDVTYTDEGASISEFYPSGAKRFQGTFNNGAKLGLWLYYAEDGTEKARCDFGQGLFALPSDQGCKTIADELEPKGFSRPVAKASATSGNSATLEIGPQSFAFTAPKGWVADAEAGAEDGVPLVFFPKGSAWRKSGRNMYIRPVFKDGRSFAAIVEEEKQEFAANVAEYKEALLKRGKLSTGREFLTKTITYKPVMQTDSPFAVVQDDTIHEAVGFLDVSREVVLMAVLACDDEKEMKGALPSLTVLVQSQRVPKAEPDTRKKP